MFGKVRSALGTLGLLAALTACGQPAAVDTSAAKAKLEADAQSWFDYYAKVDADAMANLYAEDALLMPPGAPAVKGRAGIKAFLGEEAAKTKEGGLSLKGTVTGAGVDGDTGWVSGGYTLTDSSGATTDTGNYLSVHQLVNGQWLYIRDIWNSDQPPASPEPAAEPGQE